VFKLLGFLMVVSSSSVAFGQTPEPRTAPQVAAPGTSGPWSTTLQSSPRWYGWQTLLSDAGAISILALGSSVDSRDGTLARALQIAGAASYLFGAPAIHWLHSRPSKALASAGLRLGAPAVTGLVGYGVGALACGKNNDSEAPCSAVFGGVGLVLGFAAAITIDAAVLAREPSGPEAPVSAFVLTPNLQYDRGGWRAGLSGTF
jgi:hypothetical protein